jgi:UDP-glucose 4-epimerase
MDVYGTDYATADGTCIRDYIHVTDLARAHVVALEHLRSGGDSEIFNCGYGRGFSVLDVIETVRRVSGVNERMDVRYAARRPGDPPEIVAAADKLRAQLGWRPELDDLPTIVEHALKWERDLGGRNLV